MLNRIGVFDVSIWISPSLLSAIAGFYIYQREGDPERSMKFLGVRWIGVGFRVWFLFVFLFFVLSFFSRGVSNDPPGLVTHPWPARDPPATHPWMITRHKKNSAQFRPFSMKPVQYYAKFRDAAREDDPVVITRQISIVVDKIPIGRHRFCTKSSPHLRTPSPLIRSDAKFRHG